MADAQLPRNVARPDAVVRQLNDALPHHVGQRAPVDEDAAQLIDAAVTWSGGGGAEWNALVEKMDIVVWMFLLNK